jgi:hypothetical protein
MAGGLSVYQIVGCVFGPNVALAMLAAVAAAWTGLAKKYVDIDPELFRNRYQDELLKSRKGD